MVEVTGLDRPGLLYELTATMSKLNLNIASAHVATFGERVVDVFYVTDLLGAKISTPTRQAAIKRALVALFARPAERSQAPERGRGPADPKNQGRPAPGSSPWRRPSTQTCDKLRSLLLLRRRGERQALTGSDHAAIDKRLRWNRSFAGRRSYFRRGAAFFFAAKAAVGAEATITRASKRAPLRIVNPQSLPPDSPGERHHA